LLPTIAAQCAKLIVGVYMIVVFQVGTVFSRYRLRQVCVVMYKICLGPHVCPHVRLTEIEAGDRRSDVRVVIYRKVFSHRILLVACHVIKDKNRIWTRLRWNDVAVIEERKVIIFISSIDVNKFSRY